MALKKQKLEELKISKILKVVQHCLECNIGYTEKKISILFLFIAFILVAKVGTCLTMTLSNFLTLKPIELQPQPVALLDGLMDIHAILGFYSF